MLDSLILARDRPGEDRKRWFVPIAGGLGYIGEERVLSIDLDRMLRQSDPLLDQARPAAFIGVRGIVKYLRNCVERRCLD